MLVRTDPFRDLDRLAQQMLGTMARPAAMPMDAWRDGPVRAERRPSTRDDTDMIAAERPRGVFSRQVILGDTLDTERIQASYNAGVLTLRIPIAEKAKPRKIAITNADAGRGEITA